MNPGIVFQVDTARVLQILAREIYDSPLALLRENVQNAYDAVRMRMVRSGRPLSEGRIDVVVESRTVRITDNGIGMDEAVLRENFWKAGSSGKQSEEARKAGVVGTFGIGAMANFGVCSRLEVETRAEGSETVLKSVAERESLRIAEECISLTTVGTQRDVGTTVSALLDAEHTISIEKARQYLEPYVALLPVPVYLNQTLISGATFESRLPLTGRGFVVQGKQTFSDGTFTAAFEVRVDNNGQVLVFVQNISLAGVAIAGSMMLLQSGGQLMGLRSSFGLAPVPVAGTYELGGFADLSSLQPTAGREAVGRESIEQIGKLVFLAERAASEILSTTSAADKNNAFLQWVVNHGRFDLARRVSINLYPDDVPIALGDVKTQIGSRKAFYYCGTDNQALLMFANDTSCVLQLAQGKPRRTVQNQYLNQFLHLPELPNSAQVIKVYQPIELKAPEAAVALRVAAILRDDYLIPDVEVKLAEISHGVTVLPVKEGEQLTVLVSRASPVLLPLMQCYDTAWDVFGSFMKDFVRAHIYQRVQQFVPSSTRDGVDSLRTLLQRNRDLYRYEEAEFGQLETVLGEYLSGAVSMEEMLRTAKSAARAQSQSVTSDQVGTVEAEIPDVVQSPVVPVVQVGDEYLPSPPILREDVASNLKILITAERYPQLNGFTMLLGLSDRLVRTEADFFRAPHTTRIIWGGHRVVYIFTDATGRLSLYYDIELREPIDGNKASGGMFPTTTLITQKRIFVPVPESLTDAFRIVGGPREFYVRYDVLVSELTHE